MTQFRVDLLDPNTNLKTGSYPLTTVTTVTRRRALDRIDSWQLSCAAVDPALPDIEGKNFAVYWLWQGETYYLGQCSYLRHTIQAGGDAPTVQIEAAGQLRDLTRQTVLQRSFDGATATVNSVLSTVVPLRSGWGLGAVDTISTAAPLDFWYETIYDAVALLAETFDYHYREGTADKTLDFGVFGASSGVLAIGGGQRELHPGVYNANTRCHITDVSVRYQGDQVINRLIAFGGAVGVAAVDLSEVTSTQSGYPVSSGVLPDGESYYYIEDTASIATYGLTEQRFMRKDIRPISNALTARQFAANVLYEATLASLLNLKDRQTVYDLIVTDLEPGQIRPGDKINVLFRGWASTPTGERIWLDIDGDTSGQGKAFFVLEIEETFGDGVGTRLKINENAVHEETVEQLLASTIKSFEQAQVHVQPTISRYTVGPYTKRVSASPAVSAEFSFQLGPETLNIWYVKMLLKGEPLKSSITTAALQTTTSGASSSTSSGASSSTSSGASSSSSSAAGASHSHDTITFNRQLISVQNSNHKALYIHQNDEDFHFFTNDSGPSTTTPTSASEATHTHNIEHTHTIAHTHNIEHTHTLTPNITLTYGIFADTVRPDSLTIKVNGSTVASGVTLTGPDYDYTLDITDDILAAASLQQEHTITIECGTNRGEIQFQAQVLAVIQGIQV